MRAILSLLPVALVALSAAAAGQSINLDFNLAAGTPGTAYGAASGSTGMWNTIGTSVPNGPVALKDVSGASTSVTLNVDFGPNGYNGQGGYTFNNPNTSGANANLMDDLVDAGGGFTGTASGLKLTISGLAAGNYEIYTYCWAPDNYLPGNGGNPWFSLVSVAGSSTGLTPVGSLNWPIGGHALGQTYAQHPIVLSGIVDLEILIEANTVSGGFASLNGVQIVDIGSSPTVYCTAKQTSCGSIPTIDGPAGFASLGAGAGGFDVTCGPVPSGGNPGIVFYSTAGPLVNPINAPYGFLCVTPGSKFFRVKPPVLPVGTGCNATYTFDFGNYMATQTIDPNLVVGAQVDMQAWYRDPPNVAGANYSNAMSFVIGP